MAYGGGSLARDEVGAATGGGRGERGLVVGLRGGRRRGGGRGGQQAVCARRALRSRLLGGVAGVGGVQARTAFCHLRVQLCRTLEVDAVEHLSGGGGIQKCEKINKLIN